MNVRPAAWNTENRNAEIWVAERLVAGVVTAVSVSTSHTFTKPNAGPSG